MNKKTVIVISILLSLFSQTIISSDIITKNKYISGKKQTEFKIRNIKFTSDTKIEFFLGGDNTLSDSTPIKEMIMKNRIDTVKLVKANFTEQESEKLTMLIKLIPEDVKKEFDSRYFKWKETWSKPPLLYHSNPRMYSKSDEYKFFINYCMQIGRKALPLTFEKLKNGDGLIMNAIEDLTLKQNKCLADSIRKAGNEYARKHNMIPTQSANAINYVKVLLSRFKSSDLNKFFNEQEINIDIDQ